MGGRGRKRKSDPSRRTRPTRPSRSATNSPPPSSPPRCPCRWIERGRDTAACPRARARAMTEEPSDPPKVAPAVSGTASRSSAVSCDDATRHHESPSAPGPRRPRRSRRVMRRELSEVLSGAARRRAKCIGQARPLRAPPHEGQKSRPDGHPLRSSLSASPRRITSEGARPEAISPVAVASFAESPKDAETNPIRGTSHRNKANFIPQHDPRSVRRRYGSSNSRRCSETKKSGSGIGSSRPRWR